MQVKNKTTFRLGMSWITIFSFIGVLEVILPCGDSCSNSTALFNNIKPEELLLIMVPGVVLLANSIYPESILGKIGGYLYARGKRFFDRMDSFILKVLCIIPKKGK